MKGYKIILPLLLMTSALSLIQCNEGDLPENLGKEISFGDSLSNTTYTVALENVTIVPGELSLKVSWKPVSDEDLAYYELEWQGCNPDQPMYNLDTMLYSAQTKDTTYTITGLYNEIYTVKVKAVSQRMMKSEPSVSAAVRPIFDVVPPSGFELTKAVELAQSLILGWDKPQDEDFAGILVQMAEKGTGDWTITRRSLAEDSEMTVTGLKPLTQYDIRIVSLDRVGNYDPDEVVEGDVKTKNQVKLKNMKIFRYYTEETKGEGSNGRAVQIIDGDVNTYYHSCWQVGTFWDASSKTYKPVDSWTRGYMNYYPQWVIIDLGEAVTPTRITIWPRQASATWGEIHTVELEACVYDLYMYDPEDYGTGVFLPEHNLGTYDMSATTRLHKPYTCELTNFISDVRFIRVNFKKAWDDNLARVAEIEIEAMVDE